MPFSTDFGKISFSTNERPLHKRPRRGAYTQTPQIAFQSSVRKLKKYVIYLNLTKPNLKRPFDAFLEVIEFQQLVAKGEVLPKTHYHPRDRSGPILQHEEKAAAVVRSLGFSLVVVTVVDTTINELAQLGLDHTELGTAVEARWSMGVEYELLPSFNEWVIMKKAMRTNGFPLTLEGFIHVAVRVKRLIRAGYAVPDERVEDLSMSYAFRVVAEPMSWALSKVTSSLTFLKLTHTISCSGNKIALQIARDFDLAYAVQASEGTQKTSTYQAALGTLAVDSRAVVGRENHFLATDKQQYQFAYKQSAKRGPMPKLTRHENNAFNYAENYHEEEWEFEIAQLDGLSMAYLTPNATMKLGMTLASLGLPMPAGDIFETITFAAHKQTPRKTNPKLWFAGPSLPTWDDWFLTRNPMYKADASSRFEAYIENTDIHLPTHPWPLSTGQHGVEHNQVYVQPGESAVRTQCPTMAAYENHYMPALLYERPESRRMQNMCFNNEIWYPAVFYKLSGND
ncbi:hypothetical protein LTR56_013597 [Elasticomyces elasticus]|nr:hypothetical protein LTR56_013597 [Elasticomyces elasticus]KAK3651061.1 hypothetical protein LTR22_012309 [Elasticomyces elasticus]